MSLFGDLPEDGVAERAGTKGPLPPLADAGSKPVVRTVSTFTWSRLCTLAMALPA